MTLKLRANHTLESRLSSRLTESRGLRAELSRSQENLRKAQAELARLKGIEAELDWVRYCEGLNDEFSRTITSTGNFSLQDAKNRVKGILETACAVLGYGKADFTMVCDEQGAMFTPENYPSELSKQLCVTLASVGYGKLGDIYFDPNASLWPVPSCQGLTALCIHTHKTWQRYDDPACWKSLSQEADKLGAPFNSFTKEDEMAATLQFRDCLKKHFEGKELEQWMVKADNWIRSCNERPEIESVEEQCKRFFEVGNPILSNPEDHPTYSHYVNWLVLPVLSRSADQEQLMGWVTFLEPKDIDVHSSVPEERLMQAKTLIDHMKGYLAVASLSYQRNVEMAKRIEAEKTLSTVMTGQIHDMNNMLSATTGYLELIRAKLSGPLSDEQISKISDYAKTAQTSANNLAVITQHLFNFAKSGKKSDAPNQGIEPVAVHDVIRQPAELLRTLSREKIKVEYDFSEMPCYIESDPSMFTSAILNLYINASHAMPKGGIITTATRLVSLDDRLPDNNLCESDKIVPGEYVMISIKDTGCGMDEDTKRKVSTPYFTTKSNGSGLGLAMVKSFVRERLGYMAFNSEQGVGTEFKLYFPRFDYAQSESAINPS